MDTPVCNYLHQLQCYIKVPNVLTPLLYKNSYNIASKDLMCWQPCCIRIIRMYISLVHEWGFKFADLILLQWYPKRSIRYVFWKKLSIKIFRAKIEGRVRERHRDKLLREFLFTLPSLFLSTESSPLLLFPFPFWRGGKLLSIRFSVLRLNNASHKILHRS